MRMHRTLRLAVAGVLLAAGGIGGPLVTAAPASADASTLRVITASSWPNATTEKWVSAYCPPGMVAVGGNARIINAHGGGIEYGVKLDGAFPTRSSYVAAASTTINGYSENWILKATAFCDYEPPGYEFVSSESAANEAPGWKVVALSCPDGKVPLVVGGRAIVAGSVRQSHVTLHGYYPWGWEVSQGLTGGVTAWGHSDGSSGLWQMRATAACVYKPAGYASLDLTISPEDNRDYKVIHSNQCPAGTRVYGTAGFVDDWQGTNGDYAYLTQMSALSSNPRLAYTKGSTLIPGRPWHIIAIAICAP